MKGWAGDREHRYYFILNPYDDVGCTRCPRCDRKTKIRTFCLLIHIDPHHLLSLNKSCRFCTECELIVVKQTELEDLLAGMGEEHFPKAIGNDYVVMGALDRKLHRKGKAGLLDIKTAIERFTPFSDQLELEVTGGWMPPER